MAWFSFRQNLSPSSVATADEFINIERYAGAASGMLAESRQASTSDLLLLLYRYLGNDTAIERLNEYQRIYGVDPRQSQVSSERFIDYVERLLAGSVGTPSARLAVSSISKAEMAAPMLRTLDKTRELESSLDELKAQRLKLEQTADELRQANATLRQLDELKEEFVATVSHELRTPITSIRALSQLLAERDDLPADKRQRFHETILTECDRVNRLVTQVLNVQAAEQLPDVTDPVSLQQALVKAAAVAEPLAQAKGLEFTTELLVDDAEVLADADRLVQVFVNLLGNAIKFTDAPAGKILLYATTTTVGVARIEVRDNGRGIPADRQANVFEKFAQADFKGANKPVGNGLGLYITRAIVEHYKGRIGLRSRPGRGTTVWIELPLDT
jgi:signal transduction histidine kinase